MTQHPQIWLIGGTQESATLAIALTTARIPCVVSVTTESARSLYPPDLSVWVGRLSPEDLPAFVQTQCVCGILDASHPFAVEVSQMAIAISQRLNLPYLRYERPPLPTATEKSFETFEHLLQSGILSGQRVLLTLGYRPLHHFSPWQHQATLFARILPSINALEAALAAGFTPDRLIALRPPISAELERSLWRQWQISLVVTKASGAPGGEDVKRQVAAELGVMLAVVERPAIAYPAQTSEVSIAVQFCIRQVHRTSPAEDPSPTGSPAG